ncbi:MAG: hypothetical protein ACRD5H_05105 [Nitrososphaerales archaeon]
MTDFKPCGYTFNMTRGCPLCKSMNTMGLRYNFETGDDEAGCCGDCGFSMVWLKGNQSQELLKAEILLHGDITADMIADRFEPLQDVIRDDGSGREPK